MADFVYIWKITKKITGQSQAQQNVKFGRKEFKLTEYDVGDLVKYPACLLGI